MLHELEVHKIELEMQNEELLRTQHELEASRSRYFDLFDLAPVGYLILDQQGLILESNLTASELLGVDRKQLIKQSITRFILSEDQEIFYHHRKQLYESNKNQQCELRIVKLNKETLWVKIEATSELSEGKEPLCRVIIHDISERIAAQNALREREQLYQAILTNTPDHIILQDRQLKYIFVANPQLGLTEEDMLGKSDYDFLRKEEADNLTKIKNRIMESAKSMRFDTSIKSLFRRGKVLRGDLFSQV